MEKISSKTTKKTVTTSSSSSGQRASVSKKSATPTPAASSQQNVSSQFSPSRYSRLHEKEELSNLNDRLACYIDKVRNLENENSRLTREVRSSQETISREITSVKSMYESELSEARRLLDELSREKAKLEIDTKRLFEENFELQGKLDQKVKENNTLQNSLTISDSRLNDITSKYNQIRQEKNKLADDLKALEKERNKLAAQLAEMRKNLEDETLSRIEMENALQSVREDLAFKEQIHHQQVTELRTKKQTEISEIDGRLTKEYEERLYKSLQEIRDQYEVDLELNKEEIKKLYEEKIRSLGSQLSRNTTAASLAIEEMRQTQLRLNDLNKRLADLESEKNVANQHARDLEKQLEYVKSQYIEEIGKYDSEITRLREEMSRHVQEYQDLMDIKVALDMEIAAYRKLLEGEEARLNITPVTSPAARPKPRRVTQSKRKREYYEESEETSASDFSVSSSSKGDIEITEVCLDGNFVKLTNKGNKEIALSGWQIARKAGGNMTIFKFHRTLKIEPGATVTVWSADTPNQSHEPPENLVMKGQKWMISDDMITVLLNPDGEEIAVTEHKKRQLSSSVSTHRGDYSARRPLGRFQPGEVGGAGEEKCAIM